MSIKTLAIGAAAVIALAACGADGGPSSTTGEGIYISNCAACHGAELAGNSAGPPLRSVIYGPDEYSDADFAMVISDGVRESRWGIGLMPGFGGLSDEQVDLLVAHIRAEQDRLGLIDVRP